MQPFDFQPRTRVVFAPGAIERLGELARELNFHRTLLVADRGLVDSGHVDEALAPLRLAGIAVVGFHEFEVNPDTQMVEAGRQFAVPHDIDSIIGLGGGSSLDCAKGINFLLTNGGEMRDYLGYGKAKQPLLPMIGVPTTSGTGSEAQSYALISDAQTHVKMACGDAKASFRIALLDPALTISQPRSITATSGFDAIAHAVETYVTTRRSGLSDFFSREAWRLLESNYEFVLEQPTNLEARGAMQLGSYFAGMAIENSMLGATHACANPLTTHYSTVHGAALAMLLPSVVRWNGTVVGERYADLVRLSSSHAGSNGHGSFEILAQRLEQLATAGGLRCSLSTAGVPQSDLEMLAAEAATQWTGSFNPRQFDFAGAMEVYERAFERRFEDCRMKDEMFMKSRQLWSDKWQMKRLSAAFCLLLFAFCAKGQDTPADNWSQFRGNQRLTGVSLSDVPATLKPLWTYEAGDSIESSAAIVGGTVFVGSQKGELIALNLDNGSVYWKFATGSPIGESSPAFSAGVVYIGDLGGWINAINASNGQKLWAYKTGGEIKSSPVVVGDRVLIGSYDQTLHCLSTRNGSVLWKVKTNGPVHSTPSISNGLAYIAGCDELFRAIRVSDGREMFTISSGAYTGASPALRDDAAFYGTFDNEVLMVNLKDRSIGWRYQHPQRKFPFYSSAALFQDRIVLGGRDKMVHGLDPTGKVVWTFTTQARVESSPAIAGGRVFVGSNDGRFYVLNLATGAKLWEFTAGAPLSASPAIARGRIVIGTQDGRLYCFG